MPAAPIATSPFRTFRCPFRRPLSSSKKSPILTTSSLPPLNLRAPLQHNAAETQSPPPRQSKRQSEIENAGPADGKRVSGRGGRVRAGGGEMARGGCGEGDEVLSEGGGCLCGGV
jgi:hypothetical protein